MQPKITILIHCYNVEKFIHQCMDSVVNQTLKAIEIICINDGSKDMTLAILESYAEKDDRIKIVNKSNSGYGASMNRGLELAKGEFIGIVESDDFVELDMFERLYTVAKENNVEVVKSNFYNYFTKNNIRKKIDIIPENILNKVVKPLEEKDLFFLMPSIWAAIYSNDFLKNNNIRFLETAGASYQDTAFNFKVWASAERVYFIADAFLHYRQDNENSSIHSPNKVFCVCDEYAEIERFAKINSAIYEELKYIILKSKYNVYIWNFDRLGFPLNWQFLKVFSRDFKEYEKNNLIQKSLFTKKQYRNLRIILNFPLLFLVKKLSKRLKNKLVNLLKSWL